MSRRRRKMVRYQRDQARAAQSMAASAAQASWAQSNYLQTQGQIAAGEAEARRAVALPRWCAHCRTQNPTEARACSNCGSLAFLHPDRRYPPSPPPQRPTSAWGRFRGTSTATQVGTWVAASVVVLLALTRVVFASRGTTTPPAPTLAPATGRVVLSQSGSADVTTPNFTVTDPWTISYTYDCGNGPVSVGFSLTLNNVAGTFAEDPLPVLAVERRDAASKVENSPGTYSMHVSSTCNWKLRVTD